MSTRLEDKARAVFSPFPPNPGEVDLLRETLCPAADQIAQSPFGLNSFFKNTAAVAQPNYDVTRCAGGAPEDFSPVYPVNSLHTAGRRHGDASCLEPRMASIFLPHAQLGGIRN